MFTTNSIANTLSTLQNAYQNKKLYVDVPYCNANSQLLTQLRGIGYIQHFLVQLPTGSLDRPRGTTAPLNTRTVARVYLKYVNQAPLFSGVRCYWHLRNKVSVSLKSLSTSSYNGFDSILLVYTDRGLLTGSMCVRMRLGGILVCGFYAFICDFQHVTL